MGSAPLALEPLEVRQLLTATVASTTPDLTNDPNITAGMKSLKVVFSQTVQGAASSANYDLRAAGVDGAFGTADDFVAAVTPTYTGSTATLAFAALPAGNYQLTVDDAITDNLGNKLDGDANGTPGGDFQRLFSIVPGAASKMTVSGFPTAASAGVAGPLVVTMFDAYGNLATGYTGTIHFTSTDTAAGLPTDYSFTAADAGTHTFSATLVTLGSKTITATETTAGFTGKESGITVTAGAFAGYTITGYPSSGTAGVSKSIVVTAVDGYGNKISNYTGTVHFTSSDPQAVLPADYTFTTTNTGSRTFSATLKTAGAQTITATDTALALSGIESGISILPASAKTFAVAGFPTSIKTGVPGTFTVSAYDAYSNLATGYTGTVAFTSTDPAASLPANYTFSSADAGTQTFSATLQSAGTYSITATDTASSVVTGKQSGIVVTSTVVGFAISGLSSGTAGAPQSFIVSAVDANGQLVSGYTGTVHFSSTDPQAVLPMDYTFTAADGGDRTFSVTLKTAGMQSMAVTDATQSLSGMQTGIAVSPAAASKFSVTGFAASSTAGTPSSFTVTATDAYGNVASGYSGTVVFSSADANASLPANYTFTAADAGTHSFSAALVTAGTKSIVATDSVDATITGKQTGLVVTPAAADHYVVAVPSSVSIGQSFSVTVTAKDPYGNLATNYTGSIVLTSTDPLATLPPTTAFTAADAGVKTVSVTLASGGNQIVTATDSVDSTVTGNHSLVVTGGVSVSYRYSAASNTIYVTGPGSVTLSDIKAALPSAPLTLIDPATHTWLLSANILIQQGATLNLKGSSIGGDVDHLRMLSQNISGANAFTWISADWGNVEIDTTQISSWNPAANGGQGGVDTEYATYGRSYIRVRSKLDTDGVTPLQSRMDVNNSDIGYLGYDSSEAYGLSWKVNGETPAQDAAGDYTLYDKVDVFGNVTNSHLHDNFYSVFTFGAYAMNITDNEVDHDIGYGLDPHDDSDYMVITGNYVHHNGYDGIIESKRCDHATIENNISEYNAQNGIILHDLCDDSIIANNISRYNGLSGITVLGDRNVTVANNTVTGNINGGIAITAGSINSDIYGNDVGFNNSFGLSLYNGKITFATLGTGRPAFNDLHDNVIHDTTGYSIRLTDADDNLFADNTFYNNSSAMKFQNGQRNTLSDNTVPTDQKLAITSTTVPASVFIDNQPRIKVSVDANSSVTFSSDTGAIGYVSGMTLVNPVVGSTNTLTLTSAQIGTSSVTVFTGNLSATTGSGQSLKVASVDDNSSTRGWTAQATAVGQSMTFSLIGFTAGHSYSITKDGVSIGTAVADSTGTITFSDTATSVNLSNYLLK